jgi:hypothetical protein
MFEMNSEAPQLRFFRSLVKNNQAKVTKPCLRRSQSMPTPRKKQQRPLLRSDRKRRLPRKLNTSFVSSDQDKRWYPERVRIMTTEEARLEVFNRYKIPREYESCKTPTKRGESTVEETDDEDLVGLAFLDER